MSTIEERSMGTRPTLDTGLTPVVPVSSGSANKNNVDYPQNLVVTGVKPVSRRPTWDHLGETPYAFPLVAYGHPPFFSLASGNGQDSITRGESPATNLAIDWSRTPVAIILYDL